MNFGNVDDANREAEANRGLGAGWISLKDGETVRMRFIGGDEEPFQTLEHWHNGVRKSFICSQGWEGFPGCPLCHYQNQSNAEAAGTGRGKSPIGNANPRFHFSVISDRKVHIIKTQEGNIEKRKFINCRGDNCQMCNDGNEAIREGRRYFSLALKYARGLQTAANQQAKQCASCKGVGELKIMSHECPACEEPDIVVPQGAVRIRCPECREEVTPKPVLACDENCENPKPCDIQGCWIDVTRTGEGQSTNYTFNPRKPSDLAEGDLLLKPIDFPNVKRPKDSKDICQAMGMPNPFPDPTVDISGVADPGSSIFGATT